MTKPTFIIIGERRSGTTTLYSLLSKHPDVYLFPKPDYNFFIEKEITDSRKWIDGKANTKQWEETHTVELFEQMFINSEGHKAIGFKGPDLFFWQPSHERIKRYAPDTKFIITLRNPVTRAWSHYWNEFGKGRECVSFEKAIDLEKNRIEKSDWALNHLSYTTRGYYDETLKKFWTTHSKDKTYILILEDFFANPQSEYDKICDFLGIDRRKYSAEREAKNQNWTMIKKDWVENNFLFKLLDNFFYKAINSYIIRQTQDTEKRRLMRVKYLKHFRYPASEITMKVETRNYLKESFYGSIASLEKLLQKELTFWKE